MELPAKLCSIKSRFLLRLSQKKAKQLEGETIYIRHSNLMLEVGIDVTSSSSWQPLVFVFVRLHAP